MATITANDLAGRLRVAIARTARRLRQEADHLSPSLQAAMATVALHGPLTPSELAEREGVQRPTATKLIARLEAEGLVQRAGVPGDGRSTLISLTAPGRRLVDETRTRKDLFLAERLRQLPPDDRATLARAAELLEEMLTA